MNYLRPDEIINQLKKLGVDISRKTLYNWEQWGLIPPAEFKNSRNAIYPPQTIEQAYASYHLLTGIDILGHKIKLPVGLVRAVREIYVALEPDRHVDEWDFSYGDYITKMQHLINERGNKPMGTKLTIDASTWFIEVYEDKVREAKEKMTAF